MPPNIFTFPHVYSNVARTEALKIRQLRLPESEKVAVTHEKIGSLARGMGKAKKAQIAFEGNPYISYNSSQMMNALRTKSNFFLLDVDLIVLDDRWNSNTQSLHQIVLILKRH